MTNVKRKGFMFILSSPSGAGKTTLAKALLADSKNIKLSVSVTTRPRRKDEIHGRDYYFISNSEYDAMLKNNELLEHAEVFGHHYGTPRKQTESLLDKGTDILYDIDWQGALQLIENYKENVASVFIMPPSIKTLESRLKKRNSDDMDTINTRLSFAKEEISKSNYYDYILVNDKLDSTLDKLKSCLEAERNKRSRLLLPEFISKFD